jgi:hypothetical protein
MLKYTLFLFLFCLSSLTLLGQEESNLKYEFYFGLGGTNLMADIAAPIDSNQMVWIDFFNTIGYMGDVGLRYKLNDRHYATANLSLGQLYAYEMINDAVIKENKKTESFISELTARYEFMVFKEKKKQTVYRSLGETNLKNINLPIYLFVGVGCFFNLGIYSENSRDINGKPVLDELKYSNISLVIPYGIGFKTKVSSTSYLNLEFGLRYVFSDKIDYVEKGKYDQYQFISINYIKKLKAKENGLPKF